MDPGDLDRLGLTRSASTLRGISSILRLGALDTAPQTVSLEHKAAREDPREAS